MACRSAPKAELLSAVANSRLVFLPVASSSRAYDSQKVLRDIERKKGMTALQENVLVTGADGFIGSHLTEALVRKGHQVRAFVQYNSRNHWGWIEDLSPDLLDSIEVYAGDLRDPYSVRKAVTGCRRVFHLGALIAIPYSYS